MTADQRQSPAQRVKHDAQMNPNIMKECSVVDEEGHCLICDRVVRARLDAALYTTTIV